MKTPYIAYACLHMNMYRRMYSIQCSDKIRFPLLCIKCGVVKSRLGTHTALQAPMMNDDVFIQVATMNSKYTAIYVYNIQSSQNVGN